MTECVYRNDTDRMVIVKCVGDDNFYREAKKQAKEILSGKV